MGKFMEFLKWLFSLIWRRKSLIGILSLLILFLIGELVAIENSESLKEFFTALKTDENYKNTHYLIWLIEAIVIKGSWYTVGIILFVIILFSLLKYHEIKSAQVLNEQKISIKAKKIKKVVNIKNVERDVYI